VDTLDRPKLAAQEHWLVFYGSLQLRVAHLPRVAEWDSIVDAVLATEDHMVDSACTPMGRDPWNGAVLEQITLPRRHGGLGLRRTCPLEGQAAFVPAAAYTDWAMASSPAEFQPFKGPSGSRLRLM
jgi:hypothetical protein